MLAGRAFVYNLHPFTYLELAGRFNLEDVLNYGSLPGILECDNLDDKKMFLKSYARTYLKEEIQVEQIIRKVDHFRNFLDVSAQVNGQIINYSKISRQVGIDDKTVAQYFQILEDTLVGFHFVAHHRSVRKQQITSPKFYLFDLGIKRALERSFDEPLLPKTFAYGQAFEHFIILECHRLRDYAEKDYRFSWFKDKSGLEVDLIVNRGRQKELLVEIKSKVSVTVEDIKPLKKIAQSWDRPCLPQVWSLGSEEKTIDGVSCMPWQQGLEQLL